MRVLFATDTPTWRAPNPFQLQLMEAIAQTRAADVFHGVAPLYWPVDYDIIHFQWPETAFSWKNPTEDEFDRFCQTLRRHKQRAAVVVTVHNFGPDPRFGGMGERVYEAVYAMADVFVHLNNYSKSLLAPQRPSQQHVVIPHGDYSYYQRLPQSWSAAEEALGSSQDKLILVFGALRDEAEEALAREAFVACSRKDARLVFAGSLHPSLSPEAAAIFAARNDEGVVRIHQRIPDEQVAPLVSSSRFLLLPRTGRLNSGVIPLAFTFDRPVIVPDDALSSGLSKLGLPTYRAGDVASAASALESALSMSDADYEALRGRIRAYRSRVMNWPSIAQQHLEVYREQKRRRPFYAAWLPRSAAGAISTTAPHSAKGRRKPLVTAMVPAYNAEAFLQRTLDSLAAQTWPNLEILIADDCSTDRTGEIIDAFAKSHGNVRVLRREGNLGWLRNSNDLMRQARGDLIFFAFHDDVVAPGYVRKLVRALQERPDAIMAYSDFELNYPDGRKVVGRLKRLERETSVLGRGLTMIERPPFWGAPNRGLFRRWVYERIGGMQENAAGDFSADWPWLVHMSLLGNFVRVPQVLVWKYYQKSSKTMLWHRTPESNKAMWESAYHEVWRADVPLPYRLAIIAYGKLRLHELRSRVPGPLKRALAKVRGAR